MTRIITGIQASGTPHIGNYFGAIKPMIELQNEAKNEMFFFLADLHAFTTKRSAEEFQFNQKNSILDFLALGLDPEKSVFFRQSDVRAHAELTWYLLCRTPMGLLERGTSFKDKKAKGLDSNAGLFTYPVLMAADILLYDINLVPVGKDQKQHVEMARDIAQKFNHEFGETFVLPDYYDKKSVETLKGLDGQKMSKSYGNTIPIFGTDKEIKKKVMSIQTESKNLGDVLNPEDCTVFYFHKLFKNPNLEVLEEKYKTGNIGYGDSKKQLLELIMDHFSEARKKREIFANDDALVEDILRSGASKANAIAETKLHLVRQKLGLSPRHLV